MPASQAGPHPYGPFIEVLNGQENDAATSLSSGTPPCYLQRCVYIACTSRMAEAFIDERVAKSAVMCDPMTAWFIV